MITAIVIFCLLPLVVDVIEAIREWDLRRHPLDRWFGNVVASAASIEETF
jgi:hypothetical protein